MTDTVVSVGLTVEQWDDKFFTEYLSENRFEGEMGTNELNIIQVKESLTTKKGQMVNYALVNRLTNAAVTGRATLMGNEQDMASRSHECPVDKRRNAIRVAEIDEQYSAISLREAGRAVLKDWSMKDTEDLICASLASTPHTGAQGLTTSTIYGNSAAGTPGNETAKDAWITANSDRVYFAGKTISGVHKTSRDLITASDKMTIAHVDKMKYMATTTANPKIRPIRSESNGRLYYILYVDPRGIRDLKAEANSPLVQAQRETIKELENDRLWKGGDMLWNGVIIKEVPEFFSLWGLNKNNAGTPAEYGFAFLTGAQAVATAYAKRWRSVTEEFDYGDKYGVAIESIYGVNKMQFGSGAFASGAGDRTTLKDNGVITGMFAMAA